jgi:hypothetical protein
MHLMRKPLRLTMSVGVPLVSVYCNLLVVLLVNNKNVSESLCKKFIFFAAFLCHLMKAQSFSLCVKYFPEILSDYMLCPCSFFSNIYSGIGVPEENCQKICDKQCLLE